MGFITEGVKKSDKKTSAKHEFLYRIFLPPEVFNPIFKIGEMNKTVYYMHFAAIEYTI